MTTNMELIELAARQAVEMDNLNLAPEERAAVIALHVHWAAGCDPIGQRELLESIRQGLAGMELSNRRIQIASM